MEMSIFEAIALFLIGGALLMIGSLVGYMMCIKSCIKELSNELTLLENEQAKIKAELEVEDGNDR